MKIRVYIEIMINDEGEPLQSSGCGLVLVAERDDMVIKKELGYGLSNSTRTRSIIQALRLALCSIEPSFRRQEILLYIDDMYAYQLLNKVGNGYINEINEKFVKELRLVADTFKDMYVVVGGERDEYAIRASSIAKECADTQNNHEG